jgi:hypothetical protein
MGAVAPKTNNTIFLISLGPIMPFSPQGLKFAHRIFEGRKIFQEHIFCDRRRFFVGVSK